MAKENQIEEILIKQLTDLKYRYRTYAELKFLVQELPILNAL